jgi:hypothetical protein
VEKHPLLTWTGLGPGDVMSFEEAETGEFVTGRVEAKTTDGLIVWLRDSFDGRKAYHFHDCKAVQLLRQPE